MNTKTLIGFVVVIVVLGAAWFFVGRSSNPGVHPPPPPPIPREELISKNWNALIAQAAGPARGNPKAPWVIVECGDFECPNCGKAKPMLEKFVDESNGKVKLYFVNFPLTNIHKHAEDAAEASLAASAQGKFWPMYDMLYGNQDQLVRSEIEYNAADIPGLDTKRFTQDMETKKYARKVQDEQMLVEAAGVNVTPTFLLRSATGGEVYAYIGMQHDPKYKRRSLSDLVNNPPWVTPPGQAATKVAAKPSSP